ncbi:MAG: GNAT family N-acetyltransferase [Candidatus Thorarchaeota archaeon]
MTDRSTQDKVRDFELTMEDSARVAECFNSFDDSDSWPGGFTGGNLYTAERVFEDTKKRSDIRILVAYDGDKIVGYCNVCTGELDPEAAYVGLLGVDPAYQGKGYGKFMLIEAAETAAKAGMRRIDLHTWGGNLKAMPLYKRIGYNWVPGTRVLMESHIPGILNAPLFKEFFEKYYWYDSLKVDIRQEIDDIVEDNVGLFKYHFEGNNGDSLDVNVDREAKGICEFKLTMDGKILSASVRPKTHSGFIGLGQYPFDINVSNGLDSDISYEFKVTPTNSLKIELPDELSGVLGSTESIKYDGIFSIPVGVRAIDREKNEDEKVHSYAEFSLTLDGKRIDLYSGMIPQEAITLTTGPQFPVFSPGQEGTFGLGVRNNTDTSYTCEFVLSAPERYGLLSKPVLQVNPGELIEHPMTLKIEHDEPTGLIPIEISLFVIERGERHKIKTTTLNVGVIGIIGAIAYKSLEDYYVLETETYRLLIDANPPMVVRRIDNKILGIQMSSFAMLPDIGYPFASGGSEWDRKKFDIELVNTHEVAEIRLKAKSSDRDGLEIVVIYRATSGTEFIEMIVELHNQGKDTLNNLGVKIGGWADSEGDTLVVPTRGDIREFKSIEWGGGTFLSKSAKDYHESWFASYGETNGLRGYIWDGQYIDSIVVRRGGIPRLEYKIPDIDSEHMISISILKILVSDGSWRKVRNIWATTTGTSIDEPIPIELKPDLEIGIVPVDRPSERISESVVLLDRTKTNNMEFRIQTLRIMKFSGTLTLKLPDGITDNGRSEITADINNMSHDDPFILPLSLQVDDDENWFRRSGEIIVKFKSRNIRNDLVAVVFDSSAKVIQSIEEIEEKKLHELACSGYRMAASPDYCGNLVKYGKVGENSIFHDTFPEAKPFVWDDKHYSGMFPQMIGAGVWDWQTAVPKEKWDLENIESGPWTGYSLTSSLQHCLNLKGMVIQIRYMLLKGTPLLYAEIRAKNRTGHWNRLRFGFQGVPTPGGIKQSTLYCTKNGQDIRFEPTETGNGINPDASEGWLAYQNPESLETLGLISITKSQNMLRFYNVGPAGQWASLRDSRNLRIDEESSVSGYFVITDSPKDVKSLKSLRPPSTLVPK